MKFIVTAPDGREFEVTAPDGTSQEDALAYARQQFSQQQSKPIASATDVALNAPPKAIAGVFDALLNTPTNVTNLGKAAFGTAAGLAGRPDLMPELSGAPDFARRAFEQAGFINPNVTPQTTGQRVLDMALQGATGAALNPASSARQLLGLAATGAASGAAAQATKEATGSEALGLAAGIAVPAAASGLRAVGQKRVAEANAKRLRDAPRNDVLQAGLDAGYKLPPSTVRPSLANRTLESIAGKAATQQDASINNVEVTNRLARQAIGLPPDAPLTPQATQQVRREAFNSGYAPIERAGRIRTGAQYRKDLNAIVDKYTGAARSFPGAVRDDVAKVVDGLRVKSFDSGDAIKMTATLREEASRNFRTGDTGLAKAQRDAAKVLEDQIERHLSGTGRQAALDGFREARQLMAKTHTVENALMPGTGNIDASKLAAEFRKSPGKLNGGLLLAAAFANNFKKAVQTPQAVGSPGVSKSAALASLLTGGGGAAAIGGPGVAFGAIPLVAPPLVRSALLSDFNQRRMTPNQSSGVPGLFAGLPELTTGSVLPPLLFANDR